MLGGILGSGGKSSKSYTTVTETSTTTTDSFNQDRQHTVEGGGSVFDVSNTRDVNINYENLTPSVIERVLNSLDTGNSLASARTGELIGLGGYLANRNLETTDLIAKESLKNTSDFADKTLKFLDNQQADFGVTMNNAIKTFSDNARTAMLTVSNSLENRLPIPAEIQKMIIIGLVSAVGIGALAYIMKGKKK